MSSRTRPGVARVLLRLPRSLHASLTRAAAAANLSFNEYCVRQLATPAEADGDRSAKALVLERARAVLGDRLAGLVAVGSWVRGTAAVGSDIDVIVVVDPSQPLTRDLYRRWDAAPLSFEGRVVDAHFAHLAAGPATEPGAVWCEAAVEGRLWYDRDGRVANRLADVRRAIAEGRVVRAFAHGQPYWKGAA